MKNLQIPDELHAKLKAACAKSGQKIVFVAQQAIERYLSQLPQKSK